MVQKEGEDWLKPGLKPLNAELNPIYHLLALLGAHHIFHVRGLRVNFCTILSLTVTPGFYLPPFN